MIWQVKQRGALLLCHDRTRHIQSDTREGEGALRILGAIAHASAAPNTVERIVGVFKRITMRMGAIVGAPAANQGVFVAGVRTGALQGRGDGDGHGNNER